MNPYKMAYHGSTENSLNWADGQIDYKELHTVITDAVSGFAHLYAYSVSKCTFLAGLMGRPNYNLEDLDCPHPSLSITEDRVHFMPQVYQIWLRNLNNAFSQQLVNVLSAVERLCPMSSCYDTSYCGICSSPIKTRSSTHHIILLPVGYCRQQPATNRKRALEQVLPDASCDICPY